MHVILQSVLIGLAVGAGGTVLGALIAFAIKTTGKRLSAALLGFSGGIMLATFFFDMLPHALEDAGVLPTLLGLGLSVGVMLLVSNFVPHKDASEIDEQETAELRDGNLVRTGMLLAVGIAIHNLPQGIAIGGTVSLGVSSALIVLLLMHNIPESMAMALPLKIGGVSYRKIIGISLLAALPTVIGSFIGAAMAGISEVFIGASIAFAGGAMLYLTILELIPSAIREHRSISTVLFIAGGVLLGRLVVWITHAH